ncbi:signal recognition particle-docking protein FtsY [Alteromonas facilis]|uniref:signal recognition particle-docking protein FtsY n=1 Tax=Alteromonas facilis TaxID=2048004 RepID=UPI000C2944E3|nr:signal recognition particle-docking protein FtsY [Alteromonas facilis]
MSKFFDWFNKDKTKQSPPSSENTQQELNSEDTVTEQAGAENVDNTKGESDVHSASVNEEQHPVNTEEKAVPPPVESPVDAPQAEIAEAPEVKAEAQPEAEAAPVNSEPEPQAKPKFFERLKAGLSRTKQNIGTGFVALFKGKAIDEDLYEELETQLLVADVGIDTTNKIIDKLTESAKLSQLKDGDALYTMLRSQMNDMLEGVSAPLDVSSAEGPYVILMVGVNGVGKTTTIGKMAKQFQQQGKRVMLAAGDTFRAAAVEQLEVWGERNNIPVIAQHTGADSASVLFDALQAAKARNVDVLIADTAGRLQNKDNLMEELKKVVRVMQKIDPSAPHEVMLTVDAGTGQNAISQAKLFGQAVNVSGITLTKLDGTAKGGVIFAIADQLGIPIRYIGVGEGIDDLRPFDSNEFISALFTDNDNADS